MTTLAKADFTDLQSDGSPATQVKRRVGKRSAKAVQNTRKSASVGAKVEQLAAKKSDQGSGIREVEEARALLENQLHSLYWWVFNACKMKGFIRAKALDELHRAGGKGSETRAEQRDSAEAHISPKKQTL
jgi:hypothetical protein